MTRAFQIGDLVTVGTVIGDDDPGAEVGAIAAICRSARDAGCTSHHVVDGEEFPYLVDFPNRGRLWCGHPTLAVIADPKPELKIGDCVVCIAEYPDGDKLAGWDGWEREGAPGVLVELGNDDYDDFQYRVLFDDPDLNSVPDVGTWCHKVAPATDDAPPVVSAKTSQVGGAHYLKAVQPWDIWKAFDMDPWTANAVKYLCRWREKGGVQDLHKAQHYIQHLIDEEEAQ